jgi:hypothetical protein
MPLLFFFNEGWVCHLFYSIGIVIVDPFHRNAYLPSGTENLGLGLTGDGVFKNG